MYPEALTLLTLADQRRNELIAEAATWRRGSTTHRWRGRHRRTQRTHADGTPTSKGRAA